MGFSERVAHSEDLLWDDNNIVYLNGQIELKLC